MKYRLLKVGENAGNSAWLGVSACGIGKYVVPCTLNGKIQYRHPIKSTSRTVHPKRANQQPDSNSTRAPCGPRCMTSCAAFQKGAVYEDKPCLVRRAPATKESKCR